MPLKDVIITALLAAVMVEDCEALLMLGCMVPPLPLRHKPLRAKAHAVLLLLRPAWSKIPSIFNLRSP
jgi:hypothetical protein